MEVIVRRANELQKIQETPMISTSSVGVRQVRVREAYLALESKQNKERLTIDESKTKYMIAAGNSKTI
jgi:3'-phosphoadenosine 5'-phosphosulfate sulfotransferase